MPAEPVWFNAGRCRGGSALVANPDNKARAARRSRPALSGELPEAERRRLVEEVGRGWWRGSSKIENTGTLGLYFRITSTAPGSRAVVARAGAPRVARGRAQGPDTVSEAAPMRLPASDDGGSRTAVRLASGTLVLLMLTGYPAGVPPPLGASRSAAAGSVLTEG